MTNASDAFEKLQKEIKRPLLTCDNLKRTFRTIGVKRPNHARGIIVALTILSSAGVIVMSGEPDIAYLSVKKQFDWTLTQYSTFNITSLVIVFIITLGGVHLALNVLGMSEMWLALTVLSVMAAGSLAQGASSSPVTFYITAQAQCFKGFIPPIVKGVVSKIVPSNEAAQVISFISSCEAFMPQVGALLYSNIYSLTVGTWPLSVYFVTTGMWVIGLACIIFVMILQRKCKQKDEIQENGKAHEPIPEKS